ncbi:MAG: ImmA/IrrE family metallo-endopeptidase [Proteobacteria bacterium]|nr:ImmA/IrrE family metallo-endopeptidase [Pseudomonadota bacterium]
MTGKKNKYKEQLLRLADALVNNMMETPDEEILAEAAEEYGNPTKAADEVQEIIQRAFVAAGKERLRAANAKVRIRRAPDLGVLTFPVREKIAIVRKVITKAQKTGVCLTLAARKEEELAEENLNAKLEALVELGVVDDMGNLRQWHRGSIQSQVSDSDFPAEILLRELGVTEPEEIHRVEGIADYRGVTVHYRPLVGCEAHIVGFGDRAVAFINRTSSGPRQRFSLAHELGHWHFHRGQILTCETDGKLGTDDNDANAERSADTYAANLLMPRYLFLPRVHELGVTIETAEKLSNAFKTSITATLIRLVKIGPEPAMLVCHSRRGRKWYIRGPTVSNKWVPKNELHPRSRASKLFGKRKKNGRRRVRADMWLEHRDAASFEIYEQSRCVSNEVLTLLVFKPY